LFEGSGLLPPGALRSSGDTEDADGDMMDITKMMKASEVATGRVAKHKMTIVEVVVMRAETTKEALKEGGLLLSTRRGGKLFTSPNLMMSGRSSILSPCPVQAHRTS
jgi:hypothetical protein